MFDKKSTAISCLDLIEASNGLASCEFSSVELVKACLDQIELYDVHINAFTHINIKALAEAKKSDATGDQTVTPCKIDGSVGVLSILKEKGGLPSSQIG